MKRFLKNHRKLLGMHNVIVFIPTCVRVLYMQNNKHENINKFESHYRRAKYAALYLSSVIKTAFVLRPRYVNVT